MNLCLRPRGPFSYRRAPSQPLSLLTVVILDHSSTMRQLAPRNETYEAVLTYKKRLKCWLKLADVPLYVKQKMRLRRVTHGGDYTPPSAKGARKGELGRAIGKPGCGRRVSVPWCSV